MGNEKKINRNKFYVIRNNIEVLIVYVSNVQIMNVNILSFEALSEFRYLLNNLSLLARFHSR